MPELASLDWTNIQLSCIFHYDLTCQDTVDILKEQHLEDGEQVEHIWASLRMTGMEGNMTMEEMADGRVGGVVDVADAPVDVADVVDDIQQ